MQNRQSDYLCFKLAWGSRRRKWDRNGLSDSLVWSGMIEVADVLSHLDQEVPLAQDEHEVQALAPQAAQEPFTIGIRSRCRDGRVEDLNPGAGRDDIELRPIFLVIILNEITWLCLPISPSVRLQIGLYCQYYDKVKPMPACYSFCAQPNFSGFRVAYSGKRVGLRPACFSVPVRGG